MHQVSENSLKYPCLSPVQRHITNLVQALSPNHTKSRDCYVSPRLPAPCWKWSSWLGQEKTTTLWPLRQGRRNTLSWTDWEKIFSLAAPAWKEIFLQQYQLSWFQIKRLFISGSGSFERSQAPTQGTSTWPCASLRWLFPAICVSLAIVIQLWQL